MPSLKDLRNRIASVKSTQKITKAMQMVAVSKLRRAQSAVESARPYAEQVEAVLTNLAGAATDGQGPRLLVGAGSGGIHFGKHFHQPGAQGRHRPGIVPDMGVVTIPGAN